MTVSEFKSLKWRVINCQVTDVLINDNDTELRFGYLFLSTFNKKFSILLDWRQDRQDRIIWSEEMPYSLNTPSVEIRELINDETLKPVDFNEFQSLINDAVAKTDWIHMVSKTKYESINPIIKQVTFNLDKYADVAVFIDSLPDFSNWVTTKALEEMYETLR